MIRTGWLLVCLVAAGVVNAAELSGLRGRVDHSGTRVVFDLSAPVKYKVFSLTNPDRLVVDLNSTRADQPVSLPTTGVVQSVRAGKRDNGALRVVFDLNRQVKSKSFLLGPEGSAGHRLVLDLSSDNDSVVTARTLLDQPARPVTIVIDPGHGGIDPGALGKGGVHEKDVVLGISRELARLINRQPGMRAVLTREDDRFIKLSQRRRFADKMRADLFLSIHANSFSSTKVNGSAVYALSEKGASSAAAKALADKENAADLLGGVDLTDKDDLVKSVLMDLSQNATQQSSLQLAEKVLFGLGRVNKVHKQQVQTAGFVVLKSPSVPSVLVETAFISNPGEEKLLASAKGQKKLARAIFNGVENFVRQDMALRLANVKSSPSRSYEVQPGDTLSEVAQRHRVSLAQLRSANGIRGDRLLVGKKLVIPATHGG